MSGYDRAVWDAKERVTKSLVRASAAMPISEIHDVAGDVDTLNKAWDALTDQLVRKIAAMRETIDHLHGKLAEERKPR